MYFFFFFFFHFCSVLYRNSCMQIASDLGVHCFPRSHLKNFNVLTGSGQVYSSWKGV